MVAMLPLVLYKGGWWSPPKPARPFLFWFSCFSETCPPSSAFRFPPSRFCPPFKTYRADTRAGFVAITSALAGTVFFMKTSKGVEQGPGQVSWSPPAPEQVLFSS